MSPRRVRPWDWVAGALGVALLVVLALPWYDLTDGSLSGFQAFSFVDLWLTLTALAAIAVPLVTAWRDGPSLPIASTVIAEAVSWIGILLALWRAIDQPGGPLEATVMPWVGLLTVFALAVAVWWAMRDERAPGLKPSPPPEHVAAPPAT